MYIYVYIYIISSKQLLPTELRKDTSNNKIAVISTLPIRMIFQSTLRLFIIAASFKIII